MTDLSADATIRIMGEATMQRFHCNSSVAYTIYKGQPMIADLDVDTAGLVVPFVTATVVASTDICVGIAAEGKTVTASASESDADSWINVYVEPTIVGFKTSSFDDADMGKTIYMSDSATLSETASQNPQIGKLFRVLDGFAYVKLTTPQICSGA